MSLMEIILIIIGFIFLFIGFFAGNRKKQITTEETTETSQLSGKIAEQTIDILESKKEQVLSETEEYLNRKSNEKIMEFEEYSSQILAKVEHNHEEVVFMYQMLSDKEEEMKKMYHSQPDQKVPLPEPIPKNEKRAKKPQTQKEEKPVKKQDKEKLNKQMIELHHRGKSVLEISKLLHVGQGEVQLVLSLYDK